MRKILVLFLACFIILIFTFNDKYSIEKCVYLKDNISIEYPKISGFSENIDKINDMIKNYAINNTYVMDFNKNDDKHDDKSYLKITYRAEFLNDDILSIIMTGIYNISTAAHPLNIYFTLNIDMKECKALRYSDIYDVDGTISTIQRYAEMQLSKPIYKFIFNDEKYDIKYYMEKVDFFDNGICYSAYYKKFCVLSFSISHPLGDHAEVIIPLSVLNNNLCD